MLQQIRRTIRRYGLLPPGTVVLAGVSGGSDSVALVHLLAELAPAGGFRLAGLAHLNHRLRATADRDEAFCRDLAGALGLPIVVESADVRAWATARQLSLEDAARRLRYDFLVRAAASLGADRVAVGHTRDDQAETVLLKLLRGAGLAGLGGIYPKKGLIVRPLLDVTRAELRAYLTCKNVAWVEDETNADLSNPRNRVRHEVLPGLDRIYGGGAAAALARAADLARDDAALLDRLAEARFGELVTRVPDGLALDAASLAAEPPALIRRVLLAALRAVSGGAEIGAGHVHAAADVLAGACRGTEVPGARVELRRGTLVLSSRGSGGDGSGPAGGSDTGSRR